MSNLVVLTDLDGTLLDSVTYSFQAATPALRALRQRKIPVVLVSSKTRAEVQPIRFNLDNHDPFVVENGGALYVSTDLFGFPVEGGTSRGPFQVVEFGAPYPTLRNTLKELEQAAGIPLRGFGDMPPGEVAERTGLSLQDAVLAKQREYDEPFVVEGSEHLLQELGRLAEERGVRITRGGRFCHLMGATDKGRACRVLLDWYRRQQEPAALVAIGLGDGLNDLPMLSAVDRPIAIQRPDGTYVAEMLRPGVVRAPGIGPAGWNQAILEMLAEYR